MNCCCSVHWEVAALFIAQDGPNITYADINIADNDCELLDVCQSLYMKSDVHICTAYASFSLVVPVNWTVSQSIKVTEGVR